MFQFSARSNARLTEGHLDLQRVIRRALPISKVDFGVAEVLRLRSRQIDLVAEGKSFTMNSRHLTGHAVDLWAWVNNAVSWEWDYYYDIAKAVQKASVDENVKMTWGGVWDREIDQLSPDLEREVAQYVERRKRIRPNKKVLLDGPHFQLSWRKYPA
jgi:hypothetical protein